MFLRFKMPESGPFLLAPLIWPLGHVTTALKKDPNEPPKKVSCKNKIFQIYLECLTNIPTIFRMYTKYSKYV